uniref:caspase-3-like n=1 Tax=Styela clava TaxID=7725 RepID=UPI001939FE53|nr:caspase-3-like [Styela clava]XP_039252692.1 caspase-3-like [Styela clava]
MDERTIPGDVPPARQNYSNKERSKWRVDSGQCISDTVDAGFDANEDDDIYDMRQKEMGIFLVFSHEVFDPDLALSKREGTVTDEKGLEEVFGEIGFEVIIKRNLKKKEIEKNIDEYVKYDHSRNGSFACAVLSHGKEEGIVYAYDYAYNVKSLYEPFRDCTSLIGKPKLFFVQACRGTKLQDGNRKDATDAGPDGGMTIPREADFLIAYSTIEGYYSWRNPMIGSWFIQSLIKCVKHYSHKWDLMKILTRVNKEVCCKESNPDLYEMKGKKQCPSIVCQLTAQLYFKAKNDDATDAKIPVQASEVRPRIRSAASSGLNMKVHVTDDNVFSEMEYYRLKLESLEIKERLIAMKKNLFQEKIQKASYD